MKRADIAMYEAKRNHSAVRALRAGPRRALAAPPRHASRSCARPSRSDELELHYQPKIDVATERVVHAEALVRWRHPVHGMMPPDEFIPLAEQSGNIGIITKWVLRKAIERLRGMESRGIRPRRWR